MSRRMIYQVYVGQSSALYDRCVASVASYCDRHHITHIVQREPVLRIRPDMTRTLRSHEAVERLGYLPIFEKENAFAYLDQYDQIGIVDSDILIRSTAPDIFDHLPVTYAFGAVAERDLPCTAKHASKITKYSRSAFGQLTDVDWSWNNLGAEFYNMGMMVINSSMFRPYLEGQTPAQFLGRPEFKDFIDGMGFFRWSTDQMLLNWWVKKTGMPRKNLDWRWNTLYKAVTDDSLPQAHFVHFFLKDLLPARGENVDQLMQIISEPTS
jgi:alpha-N-acetylglucosamine transferase